MARLPEQLWWNKKERIISELFQKNSESQEIIVENSQNISEKIANFSEIIW